MAERHYTVEELLELAHKHRVLRIKVGPLEVELSPTAFESTEAPSGTPLAAEAMPSPEEMLFLHAPDLGDVGSA